MYERHGTQRYVRYELLNYLNVSLLLNLKLKELFQQNFSD